jgi:hypothetical protein
MMCTHTTQEGRMLLCTRITQEDRMLFVMDDVLTSLKNVLVWNCLQRKKLAWISFSAQFVQWTIWKDVKFYYRTVEVNNTDAEGRLVLADGVSCFAMVCPPSHSRSSWKSVVCLSVWGFLYVISFLFYIWSWYLPCSFIFVCFSRLW